jgi:hypothetical protein
MQNYPNPFNPATIITYQLPVNCHVTLKVYDVLGNEVATLINEVKPAGEYEFEFNSKVENKQLTNGVYFYQLKAGEPESGSDLGLIQTKKMILLR